MSFLEIFFIISWVIILILGLDIAKKQRFNALHFLVFLWIGFWLLIFTLFPSVLDWLWSFFGIARGADVLVYTGIIFLVYFSLLLLRKVENNSDELTGIIRELAIKNASKKSIHWKEIILVRAYNEGEVIQSTINEITKAWYQNILVINDGSRDNTLLQLEKLNNKDITIISHFKNRWAWAALETGFEYIRRYCDVKYVITFDADGQHDVEDIKKVEWYLKTHEDVDVLLWSRFKWKKQKSMPLSRKIILKLWIVFTYLLSNISLSDAHNGFRVFRNKTIHQIYLTQDDMSYASELIDIISLKNITFKEIPVNIKYTQYSLAKWQKNSNAIKIVLRMIWNKFIK